MYWMILKINVNNWFKIVFICCLSVSTILVSSYSYTQLVRGIIANCLQAQIVQVWGNNDGDITYNKPAETTADLMHFSIECGDPYRPTKFICSVDGSPYTICSTDTPIFNHQYPGNQHTLTVYPVNPITNQITGIAATFSWVYINGVALTAK
jgi:hypothetical protein